MSDSYCTNRHLDVSQHDGCMFVRKCALEAGKLSISCCIYSTAQCSRDLSVTLMSRASVKSVMQHTVAALADISMTQTIPTYLSLGCLDIKRTFRLKKNGSIHFESLFIKPNNTYDIKRWFSSAMFHLLRKPVGLYGSKRRT